MAIPMHSRKEESTLEAGLYYKMKDCRIESLLERSGGDGLSEKTTECKMIEFCNSFITGNRYLQVEQFKIKV
ncbi:MAG: hypothetical protein R2727_08295 [Bacteroidales bacterium]